MAKARRKKNIKSRDSEPLNLVAVAQKKRHIALLEKVQRGDTLSKAELRELKSFEDVEDIEPGVVRSIPEAARALGVASRTIDSWLRAGAPRNPDGSYNVLEIQAWRMARKAQADYGNGTGSQTEKDRWDVFYRMCRGKLMEIRLKKEEGEVIEVAEVEAGRVRRNLAVKNALLRFSKELPPLLVGLTAREMKAVIDRRAIEVICGFSGQEISDYVGKRKRGRG